MGGRLRFLSFANSPIKSHGPAPAPLGLAPVCELSEYILSPTTLVIMPVTSFSTKEKYRYQNGFNSHLEWVSLSRGLSFRER